MHKSLFAFLATCFAAIMLVSCSKSDDPVTTSGPQKVVYKVIGSEDVTIDVVVFMSGDSPVSRQVKGGNTWESEEVLVDRTPTISVNATGKSLESTLRLQILSNGKIIKESGTSTGEILVSTLTHMF